MNIISIQKQSYPNDTNGKKKVTPSLSSEESMLILTARLNLDLKDKVTMADLLRDNLDWSMIKSLSSRFFVQPLMFKHLSEDEFANYVPDEVMSFLKKRHLQNLVKNFIIYNDIKHILSLMNKHNIPVVLLKGAFLAEWIYMDIALRPMSDIDILCKSEDIQFVQNKLIEWGYKQYRKHEERYHSPFHAKYLTGQCKHLPAFYKQNSTKIEVHTDIFHGVYNDQADMNKVWESCTIASGLNGVQINCLSPEHQVLHLLIHLYYHIIYENEVIALYWFCDIHEVVIRYKDKIDWYLLCDMAISLRVTYQLIHIFEILKTNWNTPIPENILSHLGTGANKFRLESILRDKYGSSKATRHSYHARNIISKIKVASKITGKGKRFYFFCRLIFPCQALLIYKYNIKNSNLIYFYYDINIYLLCKRSLISFFYRIIIFLSKK